MRSCSSSQWCVELVWLWWTSWGYLRVSVTQGAAVVPVPDNVTYRVGGLAITGNRCGLARWRVRLMADDVKASHDCCMMTTAVGLVSTILVYVLSLIHI